MPTVRVELYDTHVTIKQKRDLASSLTGVVSETLGNSREEVTIVFSSTSKKDIARAGRLEG